MCDGTSADFIAQVDYHIGGGGRFLAGFGFSPKVRGIVRVCGGIGISDGLERQFELVREGVERGVILRCFRGKRGPKEARALALFGVPRFKDVGAHKDGAERAHGGAIAGAQSGTGGEEVPIDGAHFGDGKGEVKGLAGAIFALDIESVAHF